MSLPDATAPREAGAPCECDEQGRRRRIVLTGGPGAGKTAVLELVRHHFCAHVRVLPESASLLFRGGFPRGPALEERRATQRAIYFVQRELEAAAGARSEASLLLCDRGTLDGLAYWPEPEGLFEAVESTREAELAKYWAVIHLRTPPETGGYNHQNPFRTESAGQAAEVDRRIWRAWEGHPRRHVIDSTASFLEKAARALEALRAELPPSCRRSHLALTQP